MTVEVGLIILKWIWGGFTALMGGMLLHLWKEYRENKNEHFQKMTKMEQDILLLKTTMVTQDRLDEIIDRKLNPVKEQMFKLETQLMGMRDQQQSDFRELLKAIKEK